MYKQIRIIFLTSLIIGSFETAFAQEATNDSADSLQRKMMKDSLNVTDSVITAVFNIRNNFLVQSNEINGDTTLSEDARTTAMQMLISETNLGIKNALGTEAYDHYILIIRRKSANRQPLASQHN